MKDETHRYGFAARARLWLSYQRYAFLLASVAIGIAAGIVAFDPAAWYLWLAAAYPFYKLGTFTVEVYRRWPEKIRATSLADRRIESGRFTPKFIENYCGDPCFRVVAREVLSRAGIDRAERRRLIRGYAKAAKERSNVVLMVNREAGVEVRVGGGSLGSSQPTG